MAANGRALRRLGISISSADNKCKIINQMLRLKTKAKYLMSSWG